MLCNKVFADRAPHKNLVPKDIHNNVEWNRRAMINAMDRWRLLEGLGHQNVTSIS